MSSPIIRLATDADLPAINEIHSHYVTYSTSTYQLEPLTLDDRRAWFSNRPAIHPVTVAEQRGKVVAWGSLGPFRMLAGYKTTVEDSIYVHPDHVRQGIGLLLLEDQVQRSKQLGLHSIIAVIDSTQSGSLHLHQKCGFAEVGRMEQLARKFDEWRDVVFLQVIVGEV